VVDKTFSDIAEAMGYLADGDLTRSIEADYVGTFGEVKNDVNSTMANLKEIVSQMRESADVIAMASKEISSGNNSLSTRTDQQAGALQETSSSMEVLTNTVKPVFHGWIAYPEHLLYILDRAVTTYECHHEYLVLGRQIGQLR
jgi:methyl-accepting chemotaxis protein